MTKVVFFKSGDNYWGFEEQGHSGFASSGEDILCSAISAMTMLVINGGYETHGVERLGIPHTMDNDGPSSVKGRNGLVYTASGTAYPCATAIGCTWNVELAYEMKQGYCDILKNGKDIAR